MPQRTDLYDLGAERTVSGADPRTISEQALPSGTFANPPTWQYYAPWFVISNTDTITHTFTLGTRTGSGLFAPQLFQVLPGGILSLPVTPFISIAIDSNGTASAVCWFFSDNPVTGPPSAAGGTGLAASAQFTGLTAAGTVSATPVQAGFGATVTFTPLKTGIIEAKFNLMFQTATGTTQGNFQISYGLVSGGAPIQGAPATGTTVGMRISSRPPGIAVNGVIEVPAIFNVTAGVAIWLDIQYFPTSTADSLSITSGMARVEELGQ